jgi:hypothetical protein
MIGVAVVGYGYWGPNLVQNIAEILGARLVSVCYLQKTGRQMSMSVIRPFSRNALTQIGALSAPNISPIAR